MPYKKKKEEPKKRSGLTALFLGEKEEPLGLKPAEGSDKMEPKPDLMDNDVLDRMRHGLATVVRVGSGVASGPGGLPGAAISGGGEAVAQMLEKGTLDVGELDRGRILVESGLGAIPLGRVYKGGKAIAGAIKGGALGAVGTEGRKWAADEGTGPELAGHKVPLPSDWNMWDAANIGIGTGVGAVVGKTTKDAPKVTEAANTPVVPKLNTPEGLAARLKDGTPLSEDEKKLVDATLARNASPRSYQKVWEDHQKAEAAAAKAKAQAEMNKTKEIQRDEKNLRDVMEWRSKQDAAKKKTAEAEAKTKAQQEALLSSVRSEFEKETNKRVSGVLATADKQQRAGLSDLDDAIAAEQKSAANRRKVSSAVEKRAQAGWQQEAKNLNARDKFTRGVEVSRDQADTQQAKMTAAAKKQKEAKTAIDDALNQGLQENPPVVRITHKDGPVSTTTTLTKPQAEGGGGGGKRQAGFSPNPPNYRDTFKQNYTGEERRKQVMEWIGEERRKINQEINLPKVDDVVPDPIRTDPEELRLWEEALSDARKQGYTGNDEDLRTLFNERVKDARELMSSMDEGLPNYDPKSLLRHISKYGGITDDSLEWAPIWETSSGFQTGKGLTKSGKTRKGHRLATGGFQGVAHVMRAKGGRHPDDILTLLNRQHPEYAHLKTEDDLREAILEAARGRQATQATSFSNALRGAGVRPGQNWWDLADDAADFDPAKLEAVVPAKAPRVQPELPGTEGVRSQEIPTPKVAEEPGFSLTPEAAKSSSVQTALPIGPKVPSMEEAAANLKSKGEAYAAAKAAAGTAKKGTPENQAARMAGRDAHKVRLETIKLKAAQGELNDDILNELNSLHPKERDAILSELVKNEKGEISPELLTRLGLTASGAAIGASSNEEDPLLGALVGGAGGLGAGVLGPKLLKAVKADPASIDPTKSRLDSFIEAIPNYNRASLLSDPVSLGINAAIGPWGSGVAGALEHTLQGDPAGWRALKMLLSPREIGKRIKPAFEEAKEAIGRNERGELMMGEAPTTSRKIMAAPGTYMTTGDIVVRDILMKAGFPEEVARRITLTSEPRMPSFKKIADMTKTGKDKGTATFLEVALPFKRTTANVMEQGLERAPFGIGEIAQRVGRGVNKDPLVARLAQQGLGAAYFSAAYYLGSHTEQDNQTTNLIRKFLSNAGGSYSAVVSAGFAAGQAKLKDKGALGQIGAGINDAIFNTPLPSTDQIQDVGRIFTQLDKGLPLHPNKEGLERYLPTGVVPKGLTPTATENIKAVLRLLGVAED